MVYYKKKIKQYVGATAIEYGILSALISVATITGLQLTGVKLDNTYCTIATKLSQTSGGIGGGGCSSSANKSASSTNITTEEAIADGVPASFIPSTIGGTLTIDDVSVWNSNDFYTDGAVANGIGEAMEKLNSVDPIVGVYGLYDQNKNPVTDYSDAVKVTETSTRQENSNDTFMYSPGSWGNPYFKVVTKSGAVYNAIRPSGHDYGQLQSVSDSSVIYR